MAIEKGFVLLIENGIASAFTPSPPGGFNVQLPGDFVTASNPKAWAYKSILAEPTYVLEGQDAFTDWEVQVDCHGYTPVDSIALARAIDGVLRGGWSGKLPDTDQTVVFGIFRSSELIDGFNVASRTYVRTLEYRIQYAQV